MPIKNTIGFTLVELLIALMIMGIIAAIAVPRFSGLIKNYKLTNAAKVVWLDLHRAKMMAIKHGRTMRVDFTATSYHIVRVDTDAVVLSRNLSVHYPASIMAPATPVCFWTTQKHLTVKRTMG